GARYLSGSRASSWFTMAWASRKLSVDKGSATERWLTCLSWEVCRIRFRFRFVEVWFATPNSQLPTDFCFLTEDAFRLRTKKVDWKASSASCSLARTWRQTRRTIGP